MRSYITVEFDIVHSENLPHGSMTSETVAAKAAHLLESQLGRVDERLSVRAKVVTAWIEHRQEPE